MNYAKPQWTSRSHLDRGRARRQIRGFSQDFPHKSPHSLQDLQTAPCPHTAEFQDRCLKRHPSRRRQARQGKFAKRQDAKSRRFYPRFSRWIPNRQLASVLQEGRENANIDSPNEPNGELSDVVRRACILTTAQRREGARFNGEGAGRATVRVAAMCVVVGTNREQFVFTCV